MKQKLDSITIREMIKGDINECAELFVSVFSAEPWNEEWRSEVAVERVSLFYSLCKSINLVAEESNRVVGFLMGTYEPYMEMQIFFIKEFLVDNTLQKSGVGTKLWNSLEERLKHLNIEAVTLLTLKDSGAMEFYKKRGCSVNETIPLMIKNLD